MPVEPRYSPTEIEPKWQQTWAQQGLDQTPSDRSKPKFYALSMFPYPSGSLHVGHTRNYVITDVIARFKRMQGYRVLQPMGWDAFGLPAENAAIDRGIHPAEWTYQNIAQMKEQLKPLGLSIDWESGNCHLLPRVLPVDPMDFSAIFPGGVSLPKRIGGQLGPHRSNGPG